MLQERQFFAKLDCISAKKRHYLRAKDVFLLHSLFKHREAWCHGAPIGRLEMLPTGSAGSKKSHWSALNVIKDGSSNHLPNFFTPFLNIFNGSIPDGYVKIIPVVH